MRQIHKYTEKQKSFIRVNVSGRSYVEMTALFNKRFKLQLTYAQMQSAINRYTNGNGRNTRFKSGFVPYNKGKKGVFFGGTATQFKKGHTPHNYMPVGSERVNAEGFVDVKVADPNKWRPKHRIIWEAKNGPIPKGHVVLFGDGNRLNFDLDNLILVSRKQLVVMNNIGLIYNNAGSTRSGVIIADIIMKKTERIKRKG